MSEINTRIVTVTPEIAAELLTRNDRNRPINPHNLALFERKFRNGEMELNGEAIKIADTGRILDGQHRLQACVNTGIPFRVLVVDGLPESAQDSMDDGARRQPSQQLAIEGIANAVLVASIARATVLLRRYPLASVFRSTGGGRVATKSEVLAEARALPEHYQALARATRKLQRHLPLGSGGISVLYKLFHSIDSEDAEFFWDRVMDGANLDKGSAIYELRRFYQSVEDKTARNRDPVTVAAVTIKAWNAFREGRDLGLLRFRPGGASPEKFPEAI